VHHRGPSEADVTEGSGHTYTFTRRPDGKTELDAVVVRDGKNLEGRALGFVLGFFGERVLGGQMAKTVKAIEARNYGASGAGRTTDSRA
jgi:hypothetical protein